MNGGMMYILFRRIAEDFGWNTDPAKGKFVEIRVSEGFQIVIKDPDSGSFDTMYNDRNFSRSEFEAYLRGMIVAYEIQNNPTVLIPKADK